MNMSEKYGDQLLVYYTPKMHRATPHMYARATASVPVKLKIKSNSQVPAALPNPLPSLCLTPVSVFRLRPCAQRDRAWSSTSRNERSATDEEIGGRVETT